METSQTDSRPPENGDDDEKLIPEWRVNADDQILWVGVGVVALLALLAFGWTRWGGDDSVAAPIVEAVDSNSGDADVDEPDETVAAPSAETEPAEAEAEPEPSTTTAPPTTAPPSTEAAATGPDLPALGRVLGELPGAVEPEVDGNVVTLTGFVANAQEETAAIESAAIVDGVDDVQSELVLLEPLAVDVLDNQGVVNGGAAGDGTVITATGTLQSEDERADTIAAVEAIDGVTEVIDELEVSAAEALNELPTIPFATGSATILGEGQAIIDEAAEIILASDGQFQVQGYTDIRGDDLVNQELSEARAAAVVEALVTAGVDRDSLTPQGRGETQQFNEGTSPEALAENRIVLFVQTS